MKDPALESYCDQVESFFFRCKGRPGTLSPSDFARVRQWYEEGMVLEVVLDGIDAAFRAQGAGRNRDVEEVNSLGFCQPFVEQARQRRRPR